ncbi:hypothetical protein [Actinomadura litoris]|uniref:hypothetical protein n=1 Tax=Actinomadura litoris TaxID=2678616 RepID=UPI001FA6E213|nr:hypothetical protein [Actinomadura litoris]
MPPKTPVPARFRPINDVSLVTGRSYRTIQTWARRNKIDTMRHPRTGTVLVDLVAADRLSQQADRRDHQTASAP